MASNFEPVFAQLREILRRHEGEFSISKDTADHYGLEGHVGPATIEAWGGKAKSATIPVAWVKIDKQYVSYHLMGLYSNDKLQEGMSRPLLARMQGKTCFNFKTVDVHLFEQLATLTTESLRDMKAAGYVLGLVR